MQTSLSIVGLNPSEPSPVDTLVEKLATLRDEGFRRVWLAQLPFDADLPTMLAIAFREVDGLEIGSGVIPIQAQHPWQLAQRALTLNLISGGRFALGIGMSHRVVTQGVWGVPWDRPVRQMREYLDALQPLLAGQPADAAGEFWTARGSLQVPAPAPEVYLAALGPQMLRLAGRRTRGTLTWMTGPKTLAGHIVPVLRDAAVEAGHGADDVRVAASLPVSVTDDVDGARKQAAEGFGVYGTLPSYRAMLDREGFAGPEDAAIIGDENTVAQRLAELRDSGVDEFVASVFDTDPEAQARTRALLRAQDE
ncbi:TIGR03564 family F420-dependent LLM class oxidoreductase [Mycolicibacterium flavescens]|uniref:LLM class F420-dependent oxidoreductase n=1 Tax=Mycolicibacterium flavescens TaxID=1776 RepID=A0A1E3RQD6_MYCFV|nr:TIGR03564 family F420-dependent LLM class oxidoreductase [Mycolicibacterium flavescens]MCV7281585.1 TIGR03564 family F420-dependent LLM class oxidoreductase [Mycolicibacterium flavescens]ODQ91622.1 LLM class F420-dependent oxidoreductase [Mycolicibacterium flavescens]